ncbi:hypothetical protein [Cohnella algarum]|uniref:hypothetical protein n=1 Tax=Cohnella algarum TaxID=2044859 RepID=UPI001967AF27|nr:hypothetical protein [Cohnella algarum]
MRDRLEWRELALRHAPELFLDRNEPFRPVRVGVSLMKKTGPSPSFDRTVEVDGRRVGAVIEYAVYWDYDIEHLYDLEHVWVYLSPDGDVFDCEASFHGSYVKGIAPGGGNMDESGRIRLFVQPGKHAFAPVREAFEHLPNLHAATGPHAGRGGVLEPGMFKGAFKTSSSDDELAVAHLRTFRFDIAGVYEPYEWDPAMFVAWDELKAEIPARMTALLQELRETAEA